MNFNFESHEFRCINCGKISTVLPRKRSQQTATFHRKKLYCPTCHLVCNSIEIKDEFEREEFLTAFDKGKFKEEAKESIALCSKDYI